jgi:ornithine carbamoyltransferase
VHLTIASPEKYEPDPSIVEWARAHHGQIALVRDPIDAVAGADAVYTDVWVSLGDPESERSMRVAALAPYQVTTELMALARPDAVFMHCLPAHRGEEVVPAVIDGEQSIVFEQAANRMHTELAVLYALTQGVLTGTQSSASTTPAGVQ